VSDGPVDCSGRWLASAGELGLLQDFNGRAIAEVGHAGYVHPGDIVHRMFNGCRHYEVSRLFHIWEDGAGITAWVMLQPRHRSFDLQVRPDKRGGDLEVSLLLWAESELLGLLAETERPVTTLVIDVFADDAARIEAATKVGWQISHDSRYLTQRSTADPPLFSLPAGYTMRTARRDEAAAIGALHGATFGSAWQPGEYAALMVSFGYRPELEWLVVAPDGSLAGFTETWHDPISGRGLFEPVGVHPDHRRRGVGRALMARGLVHMAEAGLHTGTVCFEGDNAASRALYLGSGFEIAHEIAGYFKPTPPRRPVPVRVEP
jgi:ribosomal protein S18 acetylase RimI-like enzyme